jgi:hypothetical protein
LSFAEYAAARAKVLTAAAKRIPAASAASQARALGLWHKGGVRVANDAQFGLVLDLGVLGPVGDHTPAIEREAKVGGHLPGSLEARLIEALMAAEFRLFRTLAPRPEGGVEAEDLLDGARYRIEDRSLALPQVAGRGFAGRLMRLDGVWMTCGALAGLSDEAIGELLGFVVAAGESPPELPLLSPVSPEDAATLRAMAAEPGFPARVYHAALRHGLMGNLPA